MTIKQKDIFILTLISGMILLWNLWSGSLLSWDEAFYGSVSKEIFRTGDWINLYWSGMPWSDKPPFYMWATTFFFNIFGINEFSVRLFSALCGTGLIVAVYLLANELYSRRSAITSSLMLLTTWHFVWASKVGMLDITLTFFITLSFLFFQLGLKNRKFLFFCPIAFALAFLTKGPGAMIAPMVIVSYALLSSNKKKLLDPFLVFGALLSSIIIIYWHIAVFASYGQAFVQDYLVKHLVSRTTTAVEGHTGNLFTYLSVIPNKGRPWSMAGLVLLPLMLLRVILKKEKQHILPVLWSAIVIFIFSLVQTKIHWYILPVYPALAIITGPVFERIFRRYAIPAASMLAIFSFVYLSADKGIFNLDYSPKIKETFLNIRNDTPRDKTLFLYDISDPGLQFYAGWEGVNINGAEKLSAILERENSYVLLSNRNINLANPQNSEIVSRYPDHTLIRSIK